MIQINKPKSIYTQLSNKYNIPYQVIEVICNSPFQFINKGITNGDEQSFMLAWLFKIRKKRKQCTNGQIQTDTTKESEADTEEVNITKTKV